MLDWAVPTAEKTQNHLRYDCLRMVMTALGLEKPTALVEAAACFWRKFRQTARRREPNGRSFGGSVCW